MIYINSVTVTPTVIRMKLNETYYNPNVEILPSNATCPCVEWSTSHPDTVSVNPKYGHIRALKSGTAIVHAIAADGSGKRDYITVIVEESPVTNINITKSSLSLTEGQHTELIANLTPDTATYADIVWVSDNPDIVSVIGGQVQAKKIGSTIIRAVAVGNPYIYDTCYVTVTEPNRVRGICFAKDEYTLIVGRSDQIYPTFIPSDAYNKTLYWCSCDENIAVVDNGTITAKSVGTTTITAVTADGSYTACYNLRVVLDEVTIKYEDGTSVVTFNSTGKKWKCVNEDMVFNTENSNKLYLIERANFNLFVYPERNSSTGLIISEKRTYTNDEIKLLYAIDPHGVARYIETYASDKYSDLRDRIEYKDSMFKLLFNINPKYFRRKNEQEWETTTDTSNISAIISESETIFGMHPIYDRITIEQLSLLAVDVAQFLISAFIPGAWVGTVVFITQCIEDYVKYRYLYYADVDVVNLVNGVISSAADDGALPDTAGIESKFIESNMAWSFKFFQTYADLYNILQTEISTYPNFTRNVIKYCADNLPYVVNFTLRNGETYTLNKISEITDQI